MSCLFFGVSFVSCKDNKKVARTEQPENLKSSINESSAGPDTSASDVPKTVDSTDTVLNVRLGEKYEFTFKYYKDKKTAKLKIKDPESDAEVSVDLNVDLGYPDLATAKKLKIKINGDNEDNEIIAFSFKDRTYKEENKDRIFFIMYRIPEGQDPCSIDLLKVMTDKSFMMYRSVLFSINGKDPLNIPLRFYANKSFNHESVARDYMVDL
jgi:hypothetical protein